MDFFGIGTGELIIILVVALIFVGPDKLVGVARTMGRLARELTKSGKEFTRKLEEEIDLEKEVKELNQAGADLSRVLNQKIDLESELRDQPVPAQTKKANDNSRPSPEQPGQVRTGG